MRTLLAPIAFAAPLACMCQCITAIPATAVLVNNTSAATLTASGLEYWVCAEAYQQVFFGDSNQIWIEAGAVAGIYGNNNVVWYLGTTPLGAYGDGNTFYVNALSALSDNGTNSVVTECDVDPIFFDLSNAPMPSCTSTGLAEASERSVSAFFDPTSRQLVGPPGGQVSLVDAQGKIMLTTAIAGDGRSQFGDLVPGCYTAVVNANGKRQTLRFVVEH